MVSILPSDRSGLDVLGKYVGQGLTNALPQQYENMKFQRGMNAIDQLQASLDPKNGPVDQGRVLANLARVQAQLPGFERSPYMEYVMKHAGAEAMKGAPRAGEGAQNSTERLPQIPQREQLPEFMGQKTQQKNAEQFFPTNKELPQGKGSVPQKATTGVKLPLLNPQEILAEARKLNNAQRAAGLNSNIQDSLNEVKANEEDKKAYNQTVDTELKQGKEGQKTYGARGAEYLKKYISNPSPELEAVFQKKGEQASERGESDADINRSLAEDAKNLGNAISNITSSPTALRGYNKIFRSLNGDYRSFDESAEDIRKHMQPLIKEGLYDYTRRLVQDRGYYPEEREIIVKPLSMEVQSNFNQLPKIGTARSGSFALRPKNDITPLKEAIRNSQEKDDGFSHILGRKMAEDKGYGWQDYKNALNELENEGMELSDDQKNHRGELDEPPMTFLSGFLHDLGFTGR